MKGCDSSSKATKWLPEKRRNVAQLLARALRKLGYEVTLTPINQVVGRAAAQI